MRKIKRGLAAILAVWMLVSLLPAAALAAEETEEPTAVEEEEPVAVEEQEASAAADEVIYNLGNREITVGTDLERAASGEEPYVLFAEDGSYEIELEENAFFSAFSFPALHIIARKRRRAFAALYGNPAIYTPRPFP